MQPTILTYNLGIKQLSFELLCANFNVVIRNILPEEQSFTINSILENNFHKKDFNPNIFYDEMIVFCYFENKFLDLFLQQMRNMNIKISLKAVLTPTNCFWNSIDLHQELSKEYKSFNKTK